ncbi:hypothetical protein HHL19_16700 [Streptomyces sp. R302]|uniref:hypothetical protein n=1 Tax=unclassified Streptomyces TaxID=2593676 RepID=UPI00145F9871|nr:MULTISPECIES: hypothetical protein [unclassified Streptomyces]NML55409.1 hypothetical protein [Streptomyces sp. R301]NML80281.1 hypothetical protein [Streptomyces sp. R302]
MPTDSSGQSITLPALTDPPNITTLAVAMQSILDRAVPRFASAAARAATLTSPAEGMMSWLQDVNRLDVYTGSAWSPVLAGGAWQSYNPAWTASVANPTLGNGSIAGEYSRVGDQVTFSAKITTGSSTTYGSGPWSISLPVQAAVTVDMIGNVMVGDATGTSLYSMGAAYIPAGGQTASLYAGGLHDGALISATFPQSWAAGDRLWVSGTYRAL